MNLSDRIKEVFGLENEPNCAISINPETGDLNINCTSEDVCIFIRRNGLDQVVSGGVALRIPHINIRDNEKLIYRFPPDSVLEYGIRWEECNPGERERRQAEKVHRTKLLIMSQMGIDVDGLNFPPEYKEGDRCSDES